MLEIGFEGGMIMGDGLLGNRRWDDARRQFQRQTYHLFLAW
jgi:hypothetical protein